MNELLPMNTYGILATKDKDLYDDYHTRKALLNKKFTKEDK